MDLTEQKTKRVVSLIASSTEIVCALAAGADLIVVSPCGFFNRLGPRLVELLGILEMSFIAREGAT